MAIPFFGPFVAWAPPVIVALLTPGDHVLPAAILMGVGWLLVMNILQPRLMQEAVGIHPIVVLGSVLIGSQDRRHHRRDLRDPDRRRPLGVLLPLPRRDPRAVAGRDPGGEADRGARGPAGPGARASPRRDRPGRHGVTDDRATSDGRPRSRRRRRRRGRRDGPDEQPDMTRERARTERRDLDKERGEPVAGGAARGGPRALRPTASRSTTGRPGRRSSSRTTTASSRAGCWRSSRRWTRSATRRSSPPTRTRARSATRRR